MLKPLYTAILEDNSIFNGETDFLKPKWREITKKIKRIFYNLPSGDQLCLSNKDKYYFMTEGVLDIQGSNKKEIRIEYTYLIGLKDNKAICYKVNIKTGDVECKYYNEDDDMIQKFNKNGWR